MLTLAACSKDEVVQQNPNDAISFTATTNKAISRAADGYCNKSLPGDFKVWANVPDGEGGYKPYFSGDQFDKDGSTNNYLNNGESRYWPYSAINFFACKNATPDWKADHSTLVVTNFQVEDNVKDQVDFIYAVQNETGKPSTGQTTINFRHALSQIEFQAKNTNTKLYVEISGVSVCNVVKNGNFEFPTSSTKDLFGEHQTGGSYTQDVATSVNGTWTWNESVNPKVLKNYSIITRNDADDAPEVKVVKGDDTEVLLSVTDPASKEYNTNTMYLLPQTLTAWVPSTTDPKPADQKGAYFLVKCKIFNVADPASGYKSATDVRIWPATNEYADVAIPFSATWVAGKRYVYTFVFTDNGNGGYNPEPGGTDPEDVLVPIKLVVTVDDFVKGAHEDINMEP